LALLRLSYKAVLRDREGLGRELLGGALLVGALLFNAVWLAPELWTGRIPPNDAVFHRAAAERLADSLARGEPFLDPWVSEWSLGYPLWRSYQPLPHLAAAGIMGLTQGHIDHATAFAAFEYALLVLLPASAYAGARLLGIGPLGGGVVSLLILAPVGAGDLDRYGLGYGAFTWRGSGLFAELFALHVLLWSLGISVRALDTGRRRPAASMLLALTTLSHMIFGYVAFVTGALWAVVGPSGERPRRLIRLVTIVLPSLLLLAWFVVPLFLTRGMINHSRWEPADKWDSFGASAVFSQLGSGALLDGGRAPLLSILAAAGVLAALLSWRDALARRLLAFGIAWLLLYAGRPTWGHLLVLAGVPADLQLHRLEAVVQLAAVLIAGWGIEHWLVLAWRRHRLLAALGAASAALAIVTIGRAPARYLQDDARWGNRSLVQYEHERGDLDHAFAAVRALLATRPGRVSAGKAATWGTRFTVGAVPVYAFLTRAHLDQVSFLYHAMSLSSDIMVLRDEADAAHDVVFGVRAVVAPADMRPTANLRLRGRYGRFSIYEASPEGYFGLVDVGARYTGAWSTIYDPNATWLRSRWLREGIVMALAGGPANLPTVRHWQAFPPPSSIFLSPRGHIVNERKEGETYAAKVQLLRPCYAFLKITWDPDLVATVDGRRALVLPVTPGFAAVPVPAGSHMVEVRYAPGPMRPILLILGGLGFVAAALLLRRPATRRAEAACAASLAQIGRRLATGPVGSAAVLALLAVLALHPLFRGRLVDGHDATEYPPRLVEFNAALSDGQLPPLWAADLGAGHGQPLFEFAPPLVYLAAYPFYAAGCSLSDALQLGLAVLCFAGAIAVYRLGRRAASRPAAVAGAAAWLFAPYVALDLCVRAAFAEAAAVAMLPVALFGLSVALDRPSPRRITLGALSVALLPLAHNAVALVGLPALTLVVLARRSRQSWCTGAVTLLAGLGLSAFFWLPALLEKGLVRTDLLRQGFLNWRIHAVSPWQLLWSPWGYGLSVAGTNDGMSFGLGPLHLLLALLGVLIVLRTGEAARRREMLAFALAALAGAWLATDWSAPLWSRVESLQYLAYPWRTLCLPALFLSLLAVPGVDWLWRWDRRAALVMVGALIAVNLAHSAPKDFLTFDDEFYSPASIAHRGLNTTTREEYEPRWVGVRPPYTSEPVRILQGMGEAHATVMRSAHQEFAVQAHGPVVLETATFYYPGWRAFVDGNEVSVQPVPQRGTMSFRVPAGSHDVRLDLGSTPVRRLGHALTIITAAILAGIAAVRGRYIRGFLAIQSPGRR
jgi:uncharacterized membrane protein